MEKGLIRREGIQGWVERSHEVEEQKDQEEIEGIVVEDRECCSLRVSNFTLLPRYPEGGRERERVCVCVCVFVGRYVYILTSHLSQLC